jgi:uncharacterized protein YecT (DUF1311 family)
VKIAILTGVFALALPLGAQEKPDVLSTSPTGAFRVELAAIESSPANEDATGDVWIVSTKEPAQRVKLPKQSADSPTDDEFHFSPNEEWLFGLRHVGSGLRYGNIYHLSDPLKIDQLVPGEFNRAVWKNAAKLGAVKKDWSEAGVYAMTFFGCWSLDSSRLLIELSGGEEKRSMKSGFLYFNVRTKKFEMTDYLRKLNKIKSEIIGCAEPVDPLPNEAELKANYETLDRQLNKTYGEQVAETQKDQVLNVRQDQRDWLKRRDAGEKFYVSLFPSGEKERRHLQFLCEVTAARIESQTSDHGE